MNETVEIGFAVDYAPRADYLLMFLRGTNCFFGTIRETLAFGEKELMDQEEKLRHALCVSYADAFIDELPDVRDTVLGEQGKPLLGFSLKCSCFYGIICSISFSLQGCLFILFPVYFPH